MIYAAHAGGYIHKAYGKSALQVNLAKIMEILVIDPKTSGVDLVVLSPREFYGLKKSALTKAVRNKHEDIKVIMIYKDPKELKSIQLSDDEVEKIRVKKMSPTTIKEAIDTVLEGIELTDSEVFHKKEEKAVEPQAQKLDEHIVEEVEQPKVEHEETTLEVVEPEEQPAVEIVEKQETVEERLSNINMYADYQTFQHFLKKETITRELVRENTNYASALMTLESLDKEITSIFRSTNLTQEEKFEQMRKLAMERAGYKQSLNNILTEKVGNVIMSAVASAEEATNERIENIKSALTVIESKNLLYQDVEELNRIVRERTTIQMDLTEAISKVLNLFSIIDKTSKEVIGEFDEGLPSENAFVNNVMAPAGNLFKTENAVELSSKILRKLADGRVKLSAVEVQLQDLIKLLFQLCDKDESLITYQNNLINLLKAQRVEDVVVVDTILKSCLRIFVGPSYIGTRTTAITWAGMMSRKHNMLLLDLSGRSTFRNYGIEPVKLANFLNERVQEQLVCVEGDISNVENLRDILIELKQRLNYFPYITVILSPEQLEILNEMKNDALTVHFVTDSSIRSIELTKHVIANFDAHNVAKKLVIIDPSTDPMHIVNKTGIDPMTTKVITLPRIKRIQTLETLGKEPYKDTEVLSIFEEAFK